MIEIRISSGTPEEEAKEFEEMIIGKSVFDDVKVLQEQVAEMQSDITQLAEAIDDLQEDNRDVVIEIGDIKDDIDTINEAITDTGWKDLVLAEGVQSYGATTSPQYRKIGDIVAIRGAVTNILANNTLIGTLPKAYRPKKAYNCIQNSSMTDDTKIGTFARWKIATNGQITVEAISENATYGDGKWFPINTMFMVGDDTTYLEEDEEPVTDEVISEEE